MNDVPASDKTSTVTEVLRNAPMPRDGFPEGVFVAITAWSPLYADYNDPKMTAEYRASLFPVVLMNIRWDGRIGFPGGFRDAGMGVPDTAAKEALEEINMVVASSELAHVVTHQTAAIRVHLFRRDLGVMTREQLARILASAAEAEHCVAEGTAAWVHLADYGRGKGFHALRAGGMLATAVGEELDAVRAEMFADAPAGAYGVAR